MNIQRTLLSILACLAFFEINAQSLESDSLALVALYNACDGVNWKDKWILTNSIKTWENIEIENNRVTALNLRNNKLTGELPPEFGNLDALETLDFGENSIDNPMSEVIGMLTSLEIYRLKANSIPFSIEPGFTQNPTLRQIIVEDNTINGGIPEELVNMSSLIILDLSRNELDGVIPLITSSTLVYIDFQRNQLTGNLNNLFEFTTCLESLDLSENNLSGNIPSSIANNGQLSFLDISENQLEGELPANFGLLQFMYNLYLNNNNLSGALPGTINNMTHICQFNLSFNQFSGNLPSGFSFYNGLTLFDVQSNNFEGSIPSQIGAMSTAIQCVNSDNYINVGDNQLSGEIPNSIFDVEKLRGLNLSNNNFTGTINAGLFEKLTNLRVLGLSGNQFTGTFPPLNMPNVAALGICNNQFEGTLPVFDELPDLSNWWSVSFSLSGTSWRYYNYGGVEVETCFCPGNNFTGSEDNFVNNFELDVDELDLSCFLEPIDNDNDGYNSIDDCDDFNPDINPGATEIPNNDIDENCDGLILIIDVDNDGYNSDEDCDDLNANINPGAMEIANNDVDEDCDGIILIIDEDNDGFNSDEDCDDNNADIYPGAMEIANNGIDEDCDGMDLISSNHEEAWVAVHVYPNPTTRYLNIEMENVENHEVLIFTSLGRIIRRAKRVTTTVDLNDFTNGLYFIEIINTKGQVVSRNKIILYK